MFAHLATALTVAIVAATAFQVGYLVRLAGPLVRNRRTDGRA